MASSRRVPSQERRAILQGYDATAYDTPPAWDVHLQPNAFGLLLARWPCDWEFCATLRHMRGGDGGTALSGGAGHFIDWLTLASAFEAPWDEYEDAPVDYAHLRRAYSIP